MSSLIQSSADRLYEWLLAQDLRGHDPHDLLESPMIPDALKRSKASRLAILQLGRRSPLNLHTLLRVPRRFNAKGGGLILQGLLAAGSEIDQDWRARAESLVDQLASDAVPTKHGLGWGYPFDWQSRTHFVPKYTPTIVTTAFVGEALVHYHNFFPNDHVKWLIGQAANYIKKDVSRVTTDQGICFGYSEGDSQQVFNASLLGAAFLANQASIHGDDEALYLSRESARFVQLHQAPDGSWPYGRGSTQQWTDSFHTGYVLLSMQDIGQTLGTSEFDAMIERGYHSYRKMFFRPDGLPKYFPHDDYPLDTHAAAHAIITLTRFGADDDAIKIAEWMCGNMQNRDGSFMYQMHKNHVNRIPYIRWSNAWMFLALATLLGDAE